MLRFGGWCEMNEIIKTRIHPQNIEVKLGLGWIPSLRLPVKLWHVVVLGKTKASFYSCDDAWRWVYERYEILTHDEL
jgi:hypothetical protein